LRKKISISVGPFLERYLSAQGYGQISESLETLAAAYLSGIDSTTLSEALRLLVAVSEQQRKAKEGKNNDN
jgi:hypothetical protein